MQSVSCVCHWIKQTQLNHMCYIHTHVFTAQIVLFPYLEGLNSEEVAALEENLKVCSVDCEARIKRVC